MTWLLNYLLVMIIWSSRPAWLHMCVILSGLQMVSWLDFWTVYFVMIIWRYTHICNHALYDALEGDPHVHALICDIKKRNQHLIWCLLVEPRWKRRHGKRRSPTSMELVHGSRARPRQHSIVDSLKKSLAFFWYGTLCALLALLLIHVL